MMALAITRGATTKVHPHVGMFAMRGVLRCMACRAGDPARRRAWPAGGTEGGGKSS